MTVLIALAVIGLLAAVVIAAIIVTVSGAIRREEKHHTLTGEAPGPLTRVGRLLNGVYVRTPPPPATGARQLPSPLARPAGRLRPHRPGVRAKPAHSRPHRVAPPPTGSDRLGAARLAAGLQTSHIPGTNMVACQWTCLSPDVQAKIRPDRRPIRVRRL